ncbi:MAG: hypothetical protein K2N80_05455 [Lachnospiraceae bacterium]|nr:hypothetical protein [Lachnospiraceae bacterium]
MLNGEWQYAVDQYDTCLKQHWFKEKYYDENGYTLLSEDVCRKPNGQDVTMCLENGLHEKYYNLEYPTDDMRVNELLRYFRHSDPFYETEKFRKGSLSSSAGKKIRNSSANGLNMLRKRPVLRNLKRE